MTVRWVPLVSGMSSTSFFGSGDSLRASAAKQVRLTSRHELLQYERGHRYRHEDC